MKPVPEMTVSEFIRELGSKTPSPGGGAVAALSGAMGAAQLLMVAEFATLEEGFKDPKLALKEISAFLLEMAKQDAEAYAAYSEARTKRKEDPEGYAKAVERITEVPYRIMMGCEVALSLAKDILPRAPKWFACDVSIAVNSLITGAQGGRALVGANMGSLKGPVAEDYAAKLAKIEDLLEREMAELKSLILTRLPGR
jgi:formiminotetrahydrofolate cyclodeaminase